MISLQKTSRKMNMWRINDIFTLFVIHTCVVLVTASKKGQKVRKDMFQYSTVFEESDTTREYVNLMEDLVHRYQRESDQCAEQRDILEMSLGDKVIELDEAYKEIQKLKREKTGLKHKDRMIETELLSLSEMRNVPPPAPRASLINNPTQDQIKTDMLSPCYAALPLSDMEASYNWDFNNEDCPSVVGDMSGKYASLSAPGLYIMANHTFNCPARLVSWTYKCSKSGGKDQSAYAGIWRPLVDNGVPTLTLIHKTKLETRRYRLLSINVTDAPLILPGDVIGVHSDHGSVGPIQSSRQDTQGYDGQDLFAAYTFPLSEEQISLGTTLTTHSAICRMRRFQLQAVVDPLVD